jgi:hypothetical protein
LFAGKANSTTSTTASTSENTKYLFLNAEQLKPLGVELSEKGLFYLNKNPKKNSEYTHFIAFHAGENNRACEPQDIHFNPKEIENDPVFKDKNVTNNEIYIKQITNPQGSFQYASHTISGKENENTECIPVAICMSETKIKSRIDTIVFWFYPTKALQRALPKGIKMTDYLMTPKQQPYDGAKEFYKNLSSNAEMWKMLIISLGYGEGGDFPNYPEGGEAFYKYLKENIKYPEALDSKNFKGAIATVVVEFHVEKDGSISRIEPFCYINSDNKTINLDKDNELIVNSCNEEAVHVVKNMPKWIPSKDYEYMSQFRVTLPIIFSLTD